jgi:single-strand DNA-binding protein
MNSVNLTGRIGKDPEQFTFENGNIKTSFPIAVDNGYYDKKSSEWVDQAIWLNIVIFKETKIQKGDLVEVSGKIDVRNYNDKDGVKKYVTEIIAQNLKLMSRKGGATGANNEPVQNAAEFEKEQRGGNVNTESDLSF